VASAAKDDPPKPAEIVDQRTADHGFTVWAVSKSDFPLTVMVDFPTMDNLSCNVKTPISVLVQPHKRVMIARLSRINPRRVEQYNTNWTYFYGWRADKLDDFLYTLPFREGYAFRVAQGFNGQFSHQGIDALDFALPEGSVICAARGGTVIEVVQSNTQGGTTEDMKTKANRIVILHDDGTTAKYAHLKFNGASVKVGDKVRAGDDIGYSGATGFASGPHLHFEIGRPPVGKLVQAYETIPMKFSAVAADGSSITTTPKERELTMRPFPPRDAPLHKLPANAVDQLITSRGLEGPTPVDVSESFNADQPIYVSFRLNVFGKIALKITITKESAAPTDPPVFETDLSQSSDQPGLGLLLDPAKIEALRGRCVIHISSDNHDLATARIRVGN
jgi:murein DD-endopeptidase MepM/ murein hydrolase activator NlpD